ncbi:hypothetical protein Tco_0428974 [Tanacetum coccineum]
MKRLIRSEKERLEVRRNVRSRKTIRSETTIRREKKHLGVRRIVNRREETIIIETRCMRDVRIKYWEKSICPTTLLPPKHHVHVGRQRKKRQRNTGYNKATCKGQGRKATTGGNNAEAGGLSAAAGEGGAGGPGSAGVASQGSSHSRWTKRRVQTERINGRVMGDGVPTQSSVAGGASEWSFL